MILHIGMFVVTSGCSHLDFNKLNAVPMLLKSVEYEGHGGAK